MGSDQEKSISTSPFEELAGHYDRWFDEGGKLIFKIEVEALRSIADILPRPWLEIGVGSGRFARELGIGSGIEPSGTFTEMARKRGIEVWQCKGEDRIFSAASFGTAFIILTLCFLDAPAAVLSEVNRILKPDGKLVVGLILKDSPWGRYYKGKKQQGHRFYRLSNFYSYAEVKQVLERSGFAVETILSTLYQQPGEVRQRETVRLGLDHGAGFTVLVAGKNAEER